MSTLKILESVSAALLVKTCKLVVNAEFSAVITSSFNKLKLDGLDIIVVILASISDSGSGSGGGTGGEDADAVEGGGGGEDADAVEGGGGNCCSGCGYPKFINTSAQKPFAIIKNLSPLSPEALFSSLVFDPAFSFKTIELWFNFVKINKQRFYKYFLSVIEPRALTT